MDSIRRWLERLGLQQYAEAFERNAVSVELIRELSDQDLEKLGVYPLGHRKLILKAAEGIGPARDAHLRPSPHVYTPKHLADKILTARPTGDGERKQVTVLFADLKGSMQLLADIDAESARRLLDPVLERMMEAVHHYEGTVNQVLGDGIMALFGAPIAHEDHAVRACYAALRMQESVKRLADVLRREEGVAIEMRVGLNSGEVVVRSIGNDLHMDYSAIGQTTHLAARMEQLATSGAILLTADTLHLAEGYVRVNPLGPSNIKGLSHPVEVFELTGIGAARTRLQAAALRGLTRFVGRDAEIEHLRRVVVQAGAGDGQVVGIVGEAGVGKSRLIYEFTHSHRVKDWLVLEAPSVSYGKATSYLPVIGLLKNYFRIGDRDDQREMREKVVGKIFTLDQSLTSLLHVLLALLDLPSEDTTWSTLEPAQRRQRTLEAVKRLLLTESRVQPLLLVFEDLHWIDSETQALLDSLVDSLASARMLLVVSYRPVYEHRWGRRSTYSQLRLDNLPTESVEELLSGLLGPDRTLAPLVQLLIKRGNPFFLEETVRMLIETGVLLGERGAYRLAGTVSDLQVPPSVQTILAARIDRLTPVQKQVLQAASVFGKDVPYVLLAEVADQPEDVLQDELAALQDAEFLYEVKLHPDAEYTFKHALTHEVTYHGLLRDRRRQLHARIVTAIESLYQDRLNEHVTRLSQHAFRGQLWEQAVRYSRRAGTRELERSAAREALIYFEQARRALQELPDGAERARQEADICFDQRNALFALGEFEAMGQVLTDACALSERIGDKRRVGWALAYRAHRHSFLADHDAAKEMGERAGSIGVELNDLGLMVVSTYYLGQANWFAGDVQSAVPALRRMLELGKGVPLAERFGMTALSAVVARWALAEVLAERGEFTEALGAGEEALLIAQTSGHRQSEVYARYGLGYAHLRRGDFTVARRVLEPALALCQELGVRVAMPYIAASLASVYTGLGQPQDALKLLEQAMLDLDSMGMRGLKSMCSVFLAEACIASGDPRAGREYAERALEFARTRNEKGWEAWSLKVLGDALSPSADGIEPALTAYRASIGIAGALGMRPVLAHCHSGLGRVYERYGRGDEARSSKAEAEAVYRELGMVSWAKSLVERYA